LDKLEEKGFILDGIFYEVSQLQILQGVFLKVEPGKICGLFGRNGSGKSTLLKIAAGQMAPSGGLTVIDSERMHKKSLKYRFTKISYLPQDSMLPKEMSVKQLIRSFPGNMSCLLEDSFISGLLGKRIGELSTGKRRYLEIQLLLSLDRAYVLLDEPFTGIEPLLIDRITDRITHLAAQGRGFLLTDHYKHYSIPIVDDAYLMINKQCRHLNLSLDLRGQLQDYGYLNDTVSA
jgi:lipopolysaccharide export system ATP-binding protein